MWKGNLLIFILAFCLVLTPITKVEAANNFKDIPDDFWAGKQIEFFAENGVINGYQDGTFKPNRAVTRAQAASILADALNLAAAKDYQMNYKDVAANHPKFHGIAAVTDNGIMSGEKGLFLPNKALTRAEMAIIIDKAFQLEGDGNTSFKDVKKDHFAYEAIDAVHKNGIAKGYQDNSFKPNNPTTRAQFVVFLGQAMGVKNQSELKELMKTVYENEANLKSYQLDGSMKMAFRFPESMLADPSFAPVAQLLGDIQVDISGSYMKDPLVVDMTVDLTLQGELGLKASLPIIMTKETMWIKVPQLPMAPLPPELIGKYIEFDMDELNAMSGQAQGAMPMNLDLQTELAVALNELFIDHFGNEFFKQVDQNAIKIPSDIQTKEVVKFELTNESIQSFVTTLVKKFLPEYFALLGNPEYVKALGLTNEEVQQAKNEIGAMVKSLDQLISDVENTVDINVFEQYSVINQDDHIGYTLTNIDLDILAKQETFGFGLSYEEKRTNLNELFSVNKPSQQEIVSFKHLTQMEEKEIVSN